MTPEPGGRTEGAAQVPSDHFDTSGRRRPAPVV